MFLFCPSFFLCTLSYQIEEEEYTSRIIQYFSTGLLTLPDGATLRSYLADKLNCDPMRITKKYTGACCLGRRAFHLRDRPRASPAEVEFARLDLHHLEQRFRLRVEHEQSGLPLPPRQEILAAHPSNAAASMSSIPSLFPWIQTVSSPAPGFMGHPSPVAPAPVDVLAGSLGNITFPQTGIPNYSNSPIGAGQMLLPGSNNG
jgi:hypothetical protein